MKKFGFRKLKCGLVSLAIGFALLSGGQVAADEVANQGASDSVERAFDQKLEDGPLTKGFEELAEKINVEVVPMDQAGPGDVIDVSVKETPEEITETDKTFSIQQTTTVQTTSIAEKTDLVGKSEPVTTVQERKYGLVVDGVSYQVKEQVTKTTNVEVIKENNSVTESAISTADIVFVIDHTLSMDDDILAVKNNITNFVNGLAQKNITTRLGLIDYDEGKGVRYHQFGNSYFTQNVPDYIAALSKIKVDGWKEMPTIPLTFISKEGNYDWSTVEGAKRFAILITDEGYDMEDGVPTKESTLKDLQAAKISLTVIGRDGYVDFEGNYAYKTDHEMFTSLTGGKYIDIKSDYAQFLSNDITNWVVETIEKGKAYKIVTDEYTFLLEIVAEEEVGKITLLGEGKKDNPVKNFSEQIKDFSDQAKTLPQTSSEDSSLLNLAGVTSLVGLAGLAYKKRRN